MKEYLAFLSLKYVQKTTQICKTIIMFQCAGNNTMGFLTEELYDSERHPGHMEMG